MKCVFRTAIAWSIPLFLAQIATADLKAGDMSDQTFATLAGRLAAGESVERLEDRIPGLAAKLKTALAVSEAHWTDSNLVDSGAKQEILPAAITAALGIPV